jgi:cytochrome P450
MHRAWSAPNPRRALLQELDGEDNRPDSIAHVAGAGRAPEDLPILPEMSPDCWGVDLAATLRDLFAREDGGLMRWVDGSVLAYRNADLKRLATNRDAGNQPASLLKSSLSADGEHSCGYQQLMSNQIFTTNPPLHRPLRKVFARQFTTTGIERFTEFAREEVDRLIDESAEKSEIDFGRDFAHILTARFWGRVLGLTDDELDRIPALMRGVAPALLLANTPAHRAEANEASAECLELISRAITRSLDGGEYPLLLEMAAEFDQIDDPGRPQNLGLMLGSTLVDGFQTIGAGLANTVHLLMLEEAQLAQVRADQRLVLSAFNEGVRLAPPIMFTQRYALRDITHDDVLIPAGTPVTMLWIAGNRDPDVFEDPDSYNLLREPGAQSTFGGGFHVCPGRNISRMLGEALLAGLTSADVEILPSGPARWAGGSELYELERMPVSIRRG